MNILSRVKSAIKRNPFFKGLAVLAAVAAVPAVMVTAGFSPSRTVYDYNVAADRTGATKPTFNSFINTPTYGDERYFFDGRKNSDATTGTYRDAVTNSNIDGEELVVRVYVHNNANQSLNANGSGVAKDTTVKIALPHGEGTAMQAVATISASNATSVTDTLNIEGASNFSLQYVPGSALLYNQASNGRPVSDSIVAGGALIGYDANNGLLPGCFDFKTVVTIKVKVVLKKTPALGIQKYVRKLGEAAWKKTVNAVPGDTLEWVVLVENTGTSTLNDVTTRDPLPPHVTFVQNSLRYVDGDQDVVQTKANDFFNNGGINVGSKAPEFQHMYLFSTTVNDDELQAVTSIRNIARTRSNETGEVADYADVVITRNMPQASFACTTLDLISSTNGTYSFSATGTAVNTTITGYTFKVNGEVKQDGASNKFDYTTNVAGTYEVTVQVKTTAGTTPVAAVCTKTFTIAPAGTFACAALSLVSKVSDSQGYPFCHKRYGHWIHICSQRR
jgi:uncharacterized repeat protein (TIGR01451 family)